MVPREKRGPPRTWRTFLANHLAVSAACDFFTVPTFSFKVLYVFVVSSHDRRRIVHVNVTHHPTAEWRAQQIVEAYQRDGNEPRFLLRDRDSIYGDVFRKKMRALGIEEVISANRSPWQNPFVERVIGSIRRECTDHMIAIGERHLLAVMKNYVAYDNRSRTHLSLKRNAPEPRTVEKTGDIVSEPVLGGLHHRYRRAA